jgi:hypothetical protein
MQTNRTTGYTAHMSIDSTVLKGLSNGNVTSLDRGVIRNADAVLLLLKEAGGVARIRDLTAALRSWRPGLHFNYLFQKYSAHGGYGFCGSSVASESTRVWHDDYSRPKGGHYSTRRTYYYRSAHGVYTITAEGYRRLAELGA